uniref:Tyrosine specific protein phosphatases domain-containing protein n=1 Tax=Panagrolaimus davidi TaxID=227884 RepID=A0A914Q330_9BILA
MDEGGKVLVFCRHGMSRSVTICIMYLVIKENLSLKNAFIEIHKVRPFIEPNLGFWKQMIEYEEKIRGKASVNIIEAARMNKEL